VTAVPFDVSFQAMASGGRPIAPRSHGLVVVVAALAVVFVLGFAVGGSARTAALVDPGAARLSALAVSPVSAVESAVDTSSATRESDLALAAAAPEAAVVPAASAGSAVVEGGTAGPLESGTESPAMATPPPGSGEGRRIVYSQSAMHVWLVEADGTVAREYPIIGRRGLPKPGAYAVYSKSEQSVSPKYGLTFNWMVRFAYGKELRIGFHDIPVKDGVPISDETQMGLPLGMGGCVRQTTENAKFLYGWASVGTPVVVLA
jgi:hypothetical protein